MDSLDSPFSPFDKMQFSDDQCFLWGEFLIEDGTREHIVPRWLLRKFDLFDHRVTLTNETSIPYRQLTIPCCSECNSKYLSRIEGVMEAAVNRGPEEVRKVDGLILYVWMAKIFYGLIFKDLSLLADRSDPESGHLMDREYIQNYRTLHGFLQSSRAEIRFDGFFPGSIFVFRVENYANFSPFDYSDNHIGLTICLRMGNVGIIACLKDDGFIFNGIEKLYRATENRKLQPIQFDEFCAIIFYRAYTMIHQGKYVSLSSPTQIPTVVKMPGMSLMPNFAEIDFSLLSQFLQEFWGKYGLMEQDIHKPPYIATYLKEFWE